MHQIGYIAEYATGQIKDCAGHCGQEILILEENKADEKYILINGDDHYCRSCMDNYAPCGCEGEDVYEYPGPYHMMYLPNSVSCKGCSINYNSICYRMEYQCVDLACDCIICNECEEDFENDTEKCKECRRKVCCEDDCSILVCDECDGDCDMFCYNEDVYRVCKSCYDPAEHEK